MVSLIGNDLHGEVGEVSSAGDECGVPTKYKCYRFNIILAKKTDHK
jgi:hypothetical protein